MACLLLGKLCSVNRPISTIFISHHCGRKAPTIDNLCLTHRQANYDVFLMQKPLFSVTPTFGKHQRLCVKREMRSTRRSLSTLLKNDDVIQVSGAMSCRRFEVEMFFNTEAAALFLFNDNKKKQGVEEGKQLRNECFYFLRGCL